MLHTIFTLHGTYRPYSFFGIISLVLLLLSAGFFIPVFVTYLRTGLVPKIPTLIVCGFAVIASLLSFFTGLQLQSGVQKNRQDFELARIEVNRQFRRMLREQEGRDNG